METIDLNDPRDIIAKSPMSAMQILIVAITIGLNALDGFDVASISFADHEAGSAPFDALRPA